ncbi:hypothetical protein FB45DRAFT_1063509 [Roridomyces roridus]|uniref:Uncharacterized protein n=1 Tax=Roridomyces roridus TaxID=1738132 RepID=A0AAD7BDI0_9AGAR|nr:hypothetical protein FB45DRAFT_1063509 [Roridomyces roridus]
MPPASVYKCGKCLATLELRTCGKGVNKGKQYILCDKPEKHSKLFFRWNPAPSSHGETPVAAQNPHPPPPPSQSSSLPAAVSSSSSTLPRFQHHHRPIQVADKLDILSAHLRASAGVSLLDLRDLNAALDDVLSHTSTRDILPASQRLPPVVKDKSAREQMTYEVMPKVKTRPETLPSAAGPSATPLPGPSTTVPGPPLSLPPQPAFAFHYPYQAQAPAPYQYPYPLYPAQYPPYPPPNSFQTNYITHPHPPNT